VPAQRAGEGAPDYPGCRWPAQRRFLPPLPGGNAAERLRAGHFVFLNREASLGWPPRWSPEAVPPLWLYQLHYFEPLWLLDYPDGRTLVRDWIAAYGPARGRVGWDAYPMSLRLSNWCGFFFGRHRESVEGDPAFRDALWRSIHLQGEWLRRHPETHLLGNHLFENAAALAFCGSCFEGEAAQRWRRAGRELLAVELPEQILADGGHFERSPMYQARLASALAALSDTGDAELRELVEEPLRAVLRALAALSHPDGEIALLNDSALDQQPPVEALLAHTSAARGEPRSAAAPGPFALAETGYYGWRGRDGHYLVCDAAPIGPDYLPGHAHGDLLSFELSLGGRRVVVDAGVHGYDGDALRAYCRSTRAHNTLELEGADQCEFWGAFRVARRGRPRDVDWRPLAAGFRLSAWHDGYQRLAGRPRHRRVFAWHEDGVLMVRDQVRASRAVAARSRLHLHPDCAIVEREGNALRIEHPGGSFAICFAGPGRLEVEESIYCPEFGRRVENRALVFSSHTAEVEMGFCLANGCRRLGYDLAGGAVADGRRYAW